MRSYRYYEFVNKWIKVKQKFPMTEEFMEKYLKDSPRANSTIIRHKPDKHATEYWVFHKDLYDIMPFKEDFNLITDYQSIRKDDCPCWVLTDNNYVGYVHAVGTVMYSKEKGYANKQSGYVKSVKPKGYYMLGQFIPQNVANKKKYVKPFLNAYIDKDDAIIDALPPNDSHFAWIGGRAENDPRLKVFIEVFLKTANVAIAYAIAFNDGKTMVHDRPLDRGYALLRRQEVIEIMKGEAIMNFEKALKKAGLNDISIEDYILTKRLELVERVLVSKKDSLLPLADKALTGLETIAGVHKKVTRKTEEQAIKIQLSGDDKSKLLGNNTVEVTGEVQ